MLFRSGHTDAEDGVGAELALRRRAVELDHRAIKAGLIVGVEANELGREDLVHVLHGLQHALAEIARLVAIAQLDGLVGSGRGTRWHRGPALAAVLEHHVELAVRHDQLILVHTPHLEDKLKGTRLTMDALANAGIDPGRVLIDHVEEHTVAAVLDRGYWAGMTLYPDSKCTPQRAVDIIECYGAERLWINSAGDWGPSDPLAVPKCHVEMRRRGHPAALVEKISYTNPLAFLGQSDRFRVAP